MLASGTWIEAQMSGSAYNIAVLKVIWAFLCHSLRQGRVLFGRFNALPRASFSRTLPLFEQTKFNVSRQSFMAQHDYSVK